MADENVTVLEVDAIQQSSLIELSRVKEEPVLSSHLGDLEIIEDERLPFGAVKEEIPEFLGLNVEEESEGEEEHLRVWLIDDDGNAVEAFTEDKRSIKPQVQPYFDSQNKNEEQKHSTKRRINKATFKEEKLKNNCKQKQDNRDKALERENFQCPICQKVFGGRKPFRLHLHQHIETKNGKYFCCLCHYSTFLVGHINRHMLWVHCSANNNEYKEKKYVCNICKKGFFERKDLMRHKFVHTGIGVLKCHLCDFSHNVRGLLEKHQLVSHNLVPVTKKKKSTDVYKCDYCGLTTQWKGSLRIHIAATHLCNYKYQCDQCGYGSICSGSMKKHMTIHSSERPFVCNECSKTFKRRAHLLSHLKSCERKRKHLYNKK